MLIQFNTDHNIEGREKLAAHVKTVIEHALDHFSAHITRVEVHLSDENRTKGHDDKRCMLEARLEGRQPTAVTHHAATIEIAVQGAAEKLKHSIATALERKHERRT